MLMTEKDADVIDQEWETLILEARKIGLSIEDVRNFLLQDDVKPGTY